MPKYLFRVDYTLDGVRGLTAKGGTARRAAVAASMEDLGGKLEAFYFAFGESDAYLIADLPTNEAAATVALTATAAGGARVRTTVLVEPEQLDEAARHHIDYTPPGA